MAKNDTHRVVRRQDNGRTSVLAESTNVEDAEQYVYDNFPRPHVEPGSVPDRLRGDVQLVAPDGSVREYHGSAGWVDINEDDEVDDPFDDDDDEEEVE